MQKTCVDCGKVIKGFYAKRCKSCATKQVSKDPRKCSGYIDGRSFKKKCCVDCGKTLGIRNNSGKCLSCSHKGKHQSLETKQKISKATKGSNHPSYIDGRSFIPKYCPDCGKKISWQSKKCKFCATYNKGKKLEELHGINCGCSFCKSKRGELVGNKNHNWKGGKVEKICVICGNTYVIQKARIDKNTFCSHKCYSLWLSQNIRKERVHNWKGGEVEKKCSICGNNFFIKRSHAVRTQFCSNKCRGIWMSKNLLGDKTPNWQGGKSFEEYPKEFSMIKKEIRERDNFTCHLCFNPGNSVHHIDYNKKNNTKENLITLCVSCHTKTGINRNHWTDYFNQLMLSSKYDLMNYV